MTDAQDAPLRASGSQVGSRPSPGPASHVEVGPGEATAAPCECGKPVPFDGGREDVCECCSTCSQVDPEWRYEAADGREGPGQPGKTESDGAGLAGRRPSKVALSAPCPTCAAPYGFHNDEPHRRAADAIPRHLCHPPKSVARQAEQQLRRRSRLARVEPPHPCELRLRDCGGQATTIDHIVPSSRGGRDNADNLRLACAACNSRKGSRLDSELTEYDYPLGDHRAPGWRPSNRALTAIDDRLVRDDQ